MLGASISLRPDGAVLPGRSWPGDELTRRVRDQIAAEHEAHLVRDWLLFLARTAAGDVARPPYSRRPLRTMAPGAQHGA